MHQLSSTAKNRIFILKTPILAARTFTGAHIGDVISLQEHTTGDCNLQTANYVRTAEEEKAAAFKLQTAYCRRTSHQERYTLMRYAGARRCEQPTTSTVRQETEKARPQGLK